MRVLIFAAVFSIIAATPGLSVQVTTENGTMELPICGGLPDFKCNSDQWCDHPTEAICGIGDHFGICRPRRFACPLLENKVCGCDNRTYSNSCFANQAGQDVLHPGECRNPRND